MPFAHYPLNYSPDCTNTLITDKRGVGSDLNIGVVGGKSLGALIE